jgi:hypothetical protein
MNQESRNSSILAKYIPEKAVPTIAKWIVELDFKLKIKKERSTKFGDWRAPHNGSNHQITINYNLNKYAFLVTLVHEIAHLTTWNKHRHHVLPHGSEWKQEFKIMMQPFLDSEIFPVELLYALRKYLNNPAASSCTDKNLYRALRLYDENPGAGIYVEKLPLRTVFLFEGKLFEKGPRIRTRYECKEVKTGRTFFFNPLAEVEIFDEKVNET